MIYRPFNMSRIGAAHISQGLPCQDASASETYHDAYIAVVADGHGSRRHFRSDRGSAMACQAALEGIRAFLDDSGDSRPMDDRLTDLKRSVCGAWTDAVRRDYEGDPWTEEELEEQRGLLTEEQFQALSCGRDAPVAYGSTLCAVFAYDGGWAAIQLGDGSFVWIGETGLYEWPMPRSLMNAGNRTASLCMRDPMQDFRHCWGTDRPVGLIVYTDGIGRDDRLQGAEIMHRVHWFWRGACTYGPEWEDKLAHELDLTARWTPNGDDMSVAGLVDPEAEDVEPRFGASRELMELTRMRARLAEIGDTIRFTEERLALARQNEADIRSGAVEQLENVLARKRAEMQSLQDSIQVRYDMITDPFQIRLEKMAEEQANEYALDGMINDMIIDEGIRD